jgi:hypothetical protein
MRCDLLNCCLQNTKSLYLLINFSSFILILSRRKGAIQKNKKRGENNTFETKRKKKQESFPSIIDTMGVHQSRPLRSDEDWNSDSDDESGPERIKTLIASELAITDKLYKSSLSGNRKLELSRDARRLATFLTVHRAAALYALHNHSCAAVLFSAQVSSDSAVFPAGHEVASSCEPVLVGGHATGDRHAPILENACRSIGVSFPHSTLVFTPISKVNKEHLERSLELMGPDYQAMYNAGELTDADYVPLMIPSSNGAELEVATVPALLISLHATDVSNPENTSFNTGSVIVLPAVIPQTGISSIAEEGAGERLYDVDDAFGSNGGGSVRAPPPPYDQQRHYEPSQRRGHEQRPVKPCEDRWKQ